VPEVRVVVEGLRDLNKNLKVLSVEAQKEMAEALKVIASGVVDDVKSRVPRGKTGNAQKSVRPRAGAKGAGIAFGGGRAPYYPWLDFGGRVGRQKATVRPVIRGGRYVYPAIADNMETVEELVVDALNEINRKYGSVIDGG
jgi:hypothetical protein